MVGDRPAGRQWWFSTVLLLSVAATPARTEDLIYDLLILKSGQMVEVDIQISERRARYDDKRPYTFTLADGNKATYKGGDIQEVKFREVRQLEALEHHCQIGQYSDEAKRLRAALYNFLQTLPDNEKKGALRERYDTCMVCLGLIGVKADAAAGRVAQALDALDALGQEYPQQPRVGQELAALITAQFTAARQQSDGSAARHWFGELEKRLPQSPQLALLRAQLQQDAKQLKAQAQAESAAGHIELAEEKLREAIRQTPDDQDLRNALRSLQEQTPVLSCGLYGGFARVDPLACQSYVDRTLGELCFRSLFTMESSAADAGQTRFAGDLAETWQVADDGTLVEVRLRPDLTWSDGKPLTAADVKYTLAALSDPKNAGYRPTLAALLEPGVTIYAPDRFVIRFRAQPACPLALLCFPILPEHASRAASGAVPGLPEITSGAFAPVNPTEDGLILARNERYLGPRPAIARIVVHFVTEYEAGAALLRAGRIQLLGALPSAAALQLQDAGQLGRTRAVSLYYLALNERNFAREVTEEQWPALRIVFASAMDRGALSPIADGAAAQGLFPRGTWARHPEERVSLPAYDPDAARKQIAKLDRLAARTWRCVYPQAGLSAWLAPRAARDLKAVGLKVQEKPLAAREFLSQVYERHDFDIACATYLFLDDTYDVAALFDLDGRGNLGDVRDPDVLALLAASRDTINRVAIRDRAHELEKRIVTKMYLIPLCHADEAFVFSSRLRGLTPSPRFLFDHLADWSLVPETP